MLSSFTLTKIILPNVMLSNDRLTIFSNGRYVHGTATSLWGFLDWPHWLIKTFFFFFRERDSSSECSSMHSSSNLHCHIKLVTLTFPLNQWQLIWLLGFKQQSSCHYWSHSINTQSFLCCSCPHLTPSHFPSYLHVLPFMCPGSLFF